MSDIIEYSGGFVKPAAPLADILTAYQIKKEFVSRVLKEGVDYGTIPNAGDKKVLFKAGAEKFCSFFGLSVSFEDVETIEDWSGEAHGGEPFFYYRQRCNLSIGGRHIASADGSCNSWEKKYRYRTAERVCPSCGKAAIKKSKFAPRNKKLGDAPGWYCYDKAGGCGAEFSATDKTITEQQLGSVKNPDISDMVNTVLKMAQKRALVAAAMIACGISDQFTQDVEDFVPDYDPFVVSVHATTTVAVANPNQVPPKPAAKKFPKYTTDEYVKACEVRASDGEKYGDRPDDKLKWVRDNPKSPDDKALAATIILHCRANGTIDEPAIIPEDGGIPAGDYENNGEPNFN